MIIRKIGVGDAEEAFIENRLKSGFNIIYSDDNNKGKTIVMQSALYALGNEPIFPSSFNYKDYYHYVEIELDDGRLIISCRKGDSFIVKTQEELSFLDSVSELKRYLNRNGFVFPEIVKDNVIKMVDPVLLYQLFFVGQDNKNSSTIFNDSYYKKDDFWNLVYSLAGVGGLDIVEIDVDELNSRISYLEEEKTVLLKKYEILKKTTPGLELISQKHSNEAFEEKIKKVESLRESIIELKKSKNRALQRKTINESTLSEIRSLNRTQSTGDLYCMDCGSKRIGYSSGDKSYTFDISDSVMRSNILAAIQDKIEAYQEEIDNTTYRINTLQKKMQELLKEEDIGLESVLIYRSGISTATEADTRIAEINKELKVLKLQKKTIKRKNKDDLGNRRTLFQKIISTMNQFYKTVDPAGTIVFTDLFSKRNSVYSGCEETEFYLSKLYSLAVVLGHNYPIMMDYFRDGELSTEKENIVLNQFSKLSNQIIFTSTLKEQELGKYASYKEINAIDYSTNIDSHILRAEHVDELKALLEPLMIKF